MIATTGGMTAPIAGTIAEIAAMTGRIAGMTVGIEVGGPGNNRYQSEGVSE